MTRRYVTWVARHATALIAAHAIVLAASLYLIGFHLPLRADFAYLLPEDAPAVRDLRRLEARVVTNDTVLVVVRAPTSAACAAATTELAAGIRAISRDLVARVDEDDAAARAFLASHLHVLVPLADLVRARDALSDRLQRARREANPFYVDLDGDDASGKRELDDLRARLRDTQARLARPSNLSADGRTGLIQVRSAVRATDVERGRTLLDAFDDVRATVLANHPGVEIGYAGDLVTALSEQRAIVEGTLVSSIVTSVLVLLVLVLYFRSATHVVLLVVTLAIATAAAFGVAALTVGQLNVATAFLGAIIAGNGVNYGILLTARYLEERRNREVEDALGEAIAGTARPTAIASLGASIAYGCLAATSFRGFADFAVIGGIGMALCWIATYALLPALILRFGRRGRAGAGPGLLGAALGRLFGFRRPRLVIATTAVIAGLALAIAIRFVAGDPFEYDLRKLGSEGDDAVAERAWMKLSDQAFGRGRAGRTFIAADRLDEVPQIVAALRARRASPETIGSIESILDVVPDDAPARIAVLGEIRGLLDDADLDAVDDELRPPDHIEPPTIESLPPTIREQLTERDGRIGFLISIRPADRLDELDGHDVITFAHAVETLTLANGHVVTTSGASVIFATILDAVAHDGPLVTALAALGLVAMVVIVAGWNRRAAAVLAATATGAVLMVAACALLGLRVNFLDFVALPITLGLGIDYAINIAHRSSDSDPLTTLRTSGSAVFVCSLTTMIGYGSLLVSENLAIRGFGLASLIGEVTSVLAALVLVPALLARRAG